MKSQKTQKTRVQKTQAAAEALAKELSSFIGVRVTAFVTTAYGCHSIRLTAYSATDLEVGAVELGQYDRKAYEARLFSSAGIFKLDQVRGSSEFAKALAKFNKAARA